MPNPRLVQFKNTPVWYIVWYDDTGKRRRASTDQTDYRAARIVLKNFNAQEAQRLKPVATVAQILQWDYDLWQIGRPSEEQARIAGRNLAEYFGHYSPMDLTPEIQQGYVQHRQDQGKSIGYIKRELTVLAGALNRAAESRRIIVPRILSLKSPKPKDRWLRRHEAALLLRHFRRHKRVRHLLIFSRLALFSGARTEDILSLTWDRVDFDHMKIHYDDPNAPADNKLQASVTMTRYISTMLRAERRRQIKQSRRSGILPEHVIHNRTDGVGRIYRAFKRHVTSEISVVVEDVKTFPLADVTPHTLRHTFATWSVAGGAALEVVGPVMGHKRVETTRKYAKHMPGLHAEAIRAARRKPSKTV